MHTNGHYLLLAASIMLSTDVVYGMNYSAFVTCVGPTGTGSTCQLDAGSGGFPWPVYSIINVTRSNITVKGTIYTSYTDTTLQRTSTLTNSPIMNVTGSNVTIQDLTFDGNRSGIIPCPQYNSPTDPYLATTELNLTNADYATVTGVNFPNSMGVNLLIGNHNAITYNVLQNSRIAAAEAFLPSSSTTGSYINYNDWEYTGTGALAIGSDSYAYGNYFYNGHDEFTYGSAGGCCIALFGVTNVTLANNFMDGNNVTGTTGSAAGPYGCIVPVVPPNSSGFVEGTGGIETDTGTDWYFYNNWIQSVQSAGVGILNASGTVEVSTYDPWCPTCSANPIFDSGFHGIWVFGSTSATIIFDDVYSTYNGALTGIGEGIGVDGNTPPSSFNVQFLHNACLSSNAAGRASFGTGVSVTGLPPTDTCPPH